MTDVHDPKTRSYNMSRIKGHDTKPEILVRKYLHARGLRYGLYNKKLPGKPDLSFNKYKTAVFINGCFWHGHENCKYFKLPSTRTDWWRAKINDTIIRDKNKIDELTKIGWRSIVIWECELKSTQKELTLDNLILLITKGDLQKDRDEK